MLLNYWPFFAAKGFKFCVLYYTYRGREGGQKGGIEREVQTRLWPSPSSRVLSHVPSFTGCCWSPFGSARSLCAGCSQPAWLLQLSCSVWLQKGPCLALPIAADGAGTGIPPPLPRPFSSRRIPSEKINLAAGKLKLPASMASHGIQRCTFDDFFLKNPWAIRSAWLRVKDTKPQTISFASVGVANAGC